MIYIFQVVPLDQLRLYHGLLTAFDDPIDRYNALKVGACAVLVAELSEQCRLGIAEEKRRLVIWTRNQRSAVRLVRYKGASSMRGAMNADISNAADRARSLLDELRVLVPQYRHLSDQRLQQATRYITAAEAKAYVPTYKSEVKKQRDADTSKSFAIIALLIGILVCFFSPVLGALVLLIPLFTWLAKRGEWTALRDAEATRARQIQEIKQERAVAAQFQAELSPALEPEVDETEAPSLAAIAGDLEKKYVFLDIACRDLNSHALSWNELAQEMMKSIDSPSNIGPAALRIAQGPPPLPPPLPAASLRQEPGAQPRTLTASEPMVNDRRELHHISHDWEGTELRFSLSLDQICLILQNLGYKRMPKDFSSLTSKAQQRIEQYLATQNGVSHGGYEWAYSNGEFVARKQR